MEKLTQILERYCQWIVLGLALLFLGYMGYAYLASSPVVITMGPEKKELQPGEVDPYIASHSVARLKAGMSNNSPISFPPMHEVQQFVMQLETKAAYTVHAPVEQNDNNHPGPHTQPPTTPELPGPTFVAETHGSSIVSIPSPNAAGEAVAPAAQAGAGAVPVIPAITRDIDWITVGFDIDVAALDKAFDAAHFGDPGSLTYRTQILRQYVYRQEQKPDGSWGPETLVPNLTTQQLPPLPNGAVNAQAGFSYVAWASRHQSELLTPAFYDTIQGKGTDWTEPTGATPADTGNGTLPPGHTLPPQPPQPPQRLAPTPPPGYQPRSENARDDSWALASDVSPRSVGWSAVPLPPTRPPGPLAPTRPPGPLSPPQPPGATPPFSGAPSPPSAPQPIQIKTNAAAAQTFPAPVDQNLGLFDPSEAKETTPVIKFLAHDTTVLPGHVYRYRARYAIFNPLWSGFDASTNTPAALRAMFVLFSPPGEWSPPISLEPRVKFWVHNITSSRGNALVEFDVFTRDPARVTPKRDPVRAAPGDAIGESGWTVVDIRSDHRGHFWVLISDPNGKVHRRDKNTDASDADYQNLLGQGTAAAAGGL